MIDISFLILTLDEEGVIADTIRSIRSVMQKISASYEIIVIDGGSKDQTEQVAKKNADHFIVQKEPGYHKGLLMGFKAASGKYIITLDADGSHPSELIMNLWEERNKYSIVVASRFCKGGAFDGPKYRVLLSKILNTIYQYFLKMPIRDLSSGFRLYNRNCLNIDGYECKNFSILQEILVRAYTQGYSLGSVPLKYQPRIWGKSKASAIKFTLSYLTTLKKMKKLRFNATSCDYDFNAYNSLNLIQRYWQRTRYKIITNFVNDYTNNNSPQIVDIGSGSSKIALTLKYSVSIDISISKIKFLKSQGKKNTIRASTFNLPIASNSSNIVIHSQVIEHIPFEENIFTELNRILQIGGTLIIGTPDYGKWQWRYIEWIYGKLMPNAYADEHITHYTYTSLTNLLIKFGFKIIDYKYILKGELIILAKKERSL